MNNKTIITVRTLANLAARCIHYSRLMSTKEHGVALMMKAQAYIEAAKIVVSHAKI